MSSPEDQSETNVTRKWPLTQIVVQLPDVKLQALQKFCHSLWLQASDNPELTDVTLSLDDGSKLLAHRCVLSARSSTFQGMFLSEMEEARSGNVRVREVSKASFRVFLEFMYTGSTGEDTKDADGRELWNLADLYEVDDLKQWLLSTMAEASVVEAARFASETENDAVMMACIKCASKCLPKISMESLVGLCVDVAKVLMSEHSAVLESFKFADRWHRANRQIRGNALEQSQTLLQGLNFAMITSADLMSVVKPSGLISLDRLTEIYEKRLRSQDWAAQAFHRIRAFGEHGTEIGQFNRPVGVAVDEDANIVVADQDNCRIQIFSPNGAAVCRFGSRGIGLGQFFNPVAICTSSPDSNIIVCDHDTHKVQVFRSDGAFIRAFGAEGSGRGEFLNPRDVSVTSRGEIVVCDKGNNRIQVLKEDGTHMFSFGMMGDMQAQFREPCAVAVGPEGNIVVADSGNARIQIFHPDGSFLRVFGERGDGPGQFESPDGVAVSQQGDIVVTDWKLHRITIFREDGTLVQVFGVEGDAAAQAPAGDQRIRMRGPAGVAVSVNGSIIIADQLNHRIQVLGRL